METAALGLHFAPNIFLRHNFELSIDWCGDGRENSEEMFDVVRPPCGWSRDQNCGHVTKQAAAGRRWQAAATPRDRTKVMPPVGKDKIETQRGFGPMSPMRIDTL